MGLTQLIYTSLAVRDMNVDDIDSIMSTSLKRNAVLEITGLLVYFSESREFIQLLEGGEQEVLGLYHKRIKLDPRHRNVGIFFIEYGEERLCPDWSMSFRLEDDGPLRDRMDVSDFIDGGPLGGDARAMSRQLMIAYRDKIDRSAG